MKKLKTSNIRSELNILRELLNMLTEDCKLNEKEEIAVQLIVSSMDFHVYPIKKLRWLTNQAKDFKVYDRIAEACNRNRHLEYMPDLAEALSRLDN